VTQSGIKLAVVELPGKVEKAREELLEISMDAPKDGENSDNEESDENNENASEEEDNIREDDVNEKSIEDVIDVV
jgi:hypothetical protein|tara:strand:- start:1781 stop:2005 length:225 start_codon:yes stop_codon:yes gene_type:complete